MRNPIFLSICLLASAASAQIALPGYNRTYVGNTRGFFFQAPTTFLVHAVEVPNEGKATGNQIVALYKLSAAPPAFNATVNVTPVFYDDTTPPGTKIALPTPLLYNTGEWFAALGAIGTTSGSVYNSYSFTGCAPSSLLGNTISICRCGIQANIATTKGVGALWSEIGYEPCRVRVYVAGAGQACPYGKGTNGDAELLIDDTSPPNIGATGRLKISAGTISGNVGGLLTIGIVQSNIPLPGVGVLLNFPWLLESPVAAVPNSGTVISIPIPNSKSHLGQKVYFQAGLGSPKGLHLTNGVEWIVGY